MPPLYKLVENEKRWAGKGKWVRWVAGNDRWSKGIGCTVVQNKDTERDDDGKNDWIGGKTAAQATTTNVPAGPEKEVGS
jgi:hypothetical protein